MIMKTAFKFALGILALSATVASAQDGRRGDRDGDGVRDRRPGVARPGDVVVRPNGAVVVRPQPGPVVVRPQPGPVVVRPQPAPVIVRPQPPRRPVVVFTPAPSFPVWTRSFGYSERYHDTCQRKAWRLRWFERRAESDGYLSGGERAEIFSLRRDLRRTCGDFRWRG
jgi:hypothetical protein